MNPTTTPTTSVARRVALLAVAMLAVVLAVLSGALSLAVEKSSREQRVLMASEKARSVADSVDGFDATARMMTDRAYRPFRQKFAATFDLDKAGGQLKSFGAALNNDFAEVDNFSRTNGGVATIFMRKGDDFERISTSLKKENGERAVGTTLARNHPAYPLMLEGKSYTGRAVLFGTPYMTHYEAIKDAAGQIVGILFIGFDITDFQKSLDALVANATFFESGGTTIIDPRGSNAEAVFVVHHSASGKKVLEVNPQADAMLTALRAENDSFMRDAVPLSSAGNIRWLDAIQERLDSGRGSPRLADALARAGVEYVVVRNDIDRRRSATPRSVLIRQALVRSGGFTPVAGFGPTLPPYRTPTTVIDDGLQDTVAAVEVWRVDSPLAPGDPRARRLADL